VGRGGLTLLEVLLVLCVLVLLTALVWPALHRMFINQRLRIAADQVRTAWVKARVEAMNSGRVYCFSYEPDSGTYRVQSGALEHYADVFEEVEAVEGREEEYRDAAAEFSSRVREENLPQGIRFVTLEATVDSRAEASLRASKSLDTSTQLQCTPIFFYPDGTASTARVLIGNENGRGMELFLRGMTGVVTLSDVVSLEEGMNSR
jgi:Tfp pilus assembly protein FimT